MKGATVYLLHWPPGSTLGGHYLGVAAGAGDPAVPEAVVRGTGRVQTPEGAMVADVWDCASVAEAVSLRRRLAAQGGRQRLCSVCSPGNARGQGRGRWVRKERSR